MLNSRFHALGRITAVAVGLAVLGGCGTSAGTTREQGPAPAAAPVTLDQLGWLLGAWRGTGEGRGEEFFEAYRVRDDSTFAITYFTDSTCTATQPVTGTVEERGGRIYHTYGQSRWVVTQGSPTSLHFEPVERAGNRFRWTSQGPTRWIASLTQTDSAGREVTRTYAMNRLDADDSPGAQHQRCVRSTAGGLR